MWKVGSGARLLPPLPEDPRDRRDPRMRSETSIFDNPSVDFEIKLGKDFPKVVPNLKKSLPVYAKRYVGKRQLFLDRGQKIVFG